MVRNFWDSNVENILQRKKQEIANQTHFPLKTFLGEMSRSEFLNRFEELLHESAFADLKRQTPSDIQSVEYRPGETTFMLVTILENQGSVGATENAVVLSFKRFGSEWKLYSIDFSS